MGREPAWTVVLASILLGSPLGAATIAVTSTASDRGSFTELSCLPPGSDVDPGPAATTVTGGATLVAAEVDGRVTLREAICVANNTPEPDVIVLSPATYGVVGPDNHWYGRNFLPPIGDDITIEGNGAVIWRESIFPGRFFFVTRKTLTDGIAVRSGGDRARLALRDLTLRGGWAVGGEGITGGGGAGMGGAIFNQGVLDLQRVTFESNEARGGGSGGDIGPGTGGGMNPYDPGFGPGRFGGGRGGSAHFDASAIAFQFGCGGGAGFGVAAGGDAELVAVDPPPPGVAFVFPGDGGGLGNVGGGTPALCDQVGGEAYCSGLGRDGGGGEIAPTDTTPEDGNGAGGAFGKTGNGATGCGGGGGVGGGGGGGPLLGPTFFAGHGGFGGGGGSRTVLRNPFFTVDPPETVGGDGGFGGGGGAGKTDLLGTDPRGPGGFGGGNGGLLYPGPWSGGGGAGFGGALFNHGGQVTAENTTWTGNRAIGGSVVALSPGGAGSAMGGAIFNLDGTLELRHSTLAGNRVHPGGGNGLGAAAGGALYNRVQNPDVYGFQSSVTIQGSILAGSTDLAGVPVSDCNHSAALDAGVDSDLEASELSLFETLADVFTIQQAVQGVTVACTPGSSDLLDAPGLLPLADNGGLTPTMALAAGSPAIDAAGDCSVPGTDQRGVFRPQGTGCDVGAFEVADLDFGDAPDPASPTLLASDGARHGLSSLFLGACADAEADGQPSALADGDDLVPGSPAMGTCAVAGNDDDGVVFTSGVVAGGTATVDVTASAAGLLDAWVDFDGDGVWQLGEQVFAGEALAAGANGLSFAVPPGATVGQALARFRFSTAGGLAPGGFAADGEVEDYALTISPPVAISIDDVALAEGDAGPTAFDFTVSVSSTTIAVEVTATVTGVTATAPDDFATVAPTVLTFAQGGPLPQTFTVPVAGDLRVEADETFIVTLSDPSAGAFLLDASGLGTILNDDTATVTLAPLAASGPEGNAGTSPRTFQVTLDAAVQGGFSVAYTTSDGTATTAGGDYVDDGGSLVFAGDAGETHGITVDVVGDTVVEADEAFSVALGAITGLAPGIDPADVTVAGTPAAGAIVDDDAGVFGATLEARKTLSGTPLIGATVDYTIELTNLGPGAQADNPGDELVDILPPQVALLEAIADRGVVTADPGTHTVTWNGALAPGETATLAITAEVLASALGTTVTNQATLAFDTTNDGSNDGAARSDDPLAAGTQDPTSFVGALPAEIPTLGTWGAGVLALAIGLLGMRRCRRGGRMPGGLARPG
jgi:hypothetical protein